MSTASCSYKPKFAIASLSLGTNAHHDLPTKIHTTSELGYDGIEIFIPDFEAFIDQAREGKHAALVSELHTSISPAKFDIACATAIYNLCSSLELEIPLFQPFRNFENFRSQAEIDVALAEAERWLRIMPAMKCDLLLVCSNYIPGSNPVSQDYTMELYRDVQVDAFRQLGALAEKYGVRIGYEPLSWGTVIDNWMQVWDIVERVNRENVGILLDSFNTLGNLYADPGEASTIRKGQTLSGMLANLEELSRTIPAEKIFFYQVADAVRPTSICHDEEDMPSRMKWSRANRVFPCEPPASNPPSYSDPENPPSGYLGFLPVTQMTSFVHRTGYRGWWSLEVFNSSLQESDSGCPERHGRRGIDGLRALWEVVKSDPISHAKVEDSNGMEATLAALTQNREASTPSPSTPPLSTGSLSDSSESSTFSDIDSEVDISEAADHGVVVSEFTKVEVEKWITEENGSGVLV